MVVVVAERCTDSTRTGGTVAGAGAAANQLIGSLPSCSGKRRCREGPFPSDAVGHGALSEYLICSTRTYGTRPVSGGRVCGGSGLRISTSPLPFWSLPSKGP